MVGSAITGRPDFSRDRLAQAYRPAVAQSHRTVSAGQNSTFECFARRFNQNVHHRLVENPGRRRSERLRHPLSQMCLRQRAEHVRASKALGAHFVGHAVDAAGAEDHARSTPLVNEAGAFCHGVALALAGFSTKSNCSE